jgi:hypothetical protein
MKKTLTISPDLIPSHTPDFNSPTAAVNDLLNLELIESGKDDYNPFQKLYANLNVPIS